jgi:hypothetical protein
MFKVFEKNMFDEIRCLWTHLKAIVWFFELLGPSDELTAQLFQMIIIEGDF